MVTGGAGYIGSHTCIELLTAGYQPVILDNFCNSDPAVLSRLAQICGAPIQHIAGDVRDRSLVKHLFAAQAYDSVIHFAGLKAVGESVLSPSLYYDVNIGSASVLVGEMVAAGVKKIVFSSSATVYGATVNCPIAETAPLSTGNPYGSTKLFIERLLEEQCASTPEWEVTALRYFNPVGAHPTGLIGEHPLGVPNNLMPFVAQVAAGKRGRVNVFGDDYDTADGTGVRDYIHVTDLARGHVAALSHSARGFRAINLGTGVGTSVLQMIKAFQRVSGKEIPYQIMPRRPGDSASCFANPGLAARALGWRAELNLDDMCRDAWNWQRANPNGYSA